MQSNVKGKSRHLKAELQSKGTRSAKRKLREISGRERRFVRDLNHCVANEIVNKPFDVFVFEELTAIRGKKKSKAFNRKLGNWSFAQLLQFAQYKAEALGKKAAVINPYYTSRTCSRCGHVSRSNRKGRRFTCVQCGFSLDADLNASRNIAAFSTHGKAAGSMSASRMQRAMRPKAVRVLRSSLAASPRISRGVAGIAVVIYSLTKMYLCRTSVRL